MADINLYNNQPLNIQAQSGQSDAGAYPVVPYSPNMQGVPPAMQGLDYDTVKLQVEQKAKDNAIAQATKDYDIFEHPWVMLKNAALALGMAIAGTSLTNSAMVAKDLADNVSNAEGFKKTAIYRAGQAIDNSAVGKALNSAQSTVGGWMSKLGKYVPRFIKEIPRQISVGGIAVPDKTGMFSRGKGCEALIEAVTDLGRVDKTALGNLLKADKDYVFDILKKVEAGKLHPSIAFRKLDPIISKLPANELAKLKLPITQNSPGIFGWIGKQFRRVIGTIDKVPHMEQNMNMAWNKARVFNSAYNPTKGIVTKGLQKTFGFIGEATGNGVLGGKMALFMGGLALITGFNAASKAEKGDKLPAFMEDYIGFTLGSYIMSFIVGTWFNKFLGVTELGMNKKEIVKLGKKLGLDMSKASERRLQSVVMAFNEQFKANRKLNALAEELSNGKISVEKAIIKAEKLGVDVKGCGLSRGRLGDKIKAHIGGKDKAYFDELRKGIKNVYKSELSLKAVFKQGKSKEGFLTRLGRYVVQKPLSLIGKALSIGRYDLRSGSRFSLNSIAKAAKRWGFGFGRALLVMLVLVEPFRKGFMKLSHAIFGKPKNSQLDEEENSKKQPEQQPQINNMTPASIVQPVAQTQQAQNNTNILNNMLNKTHPASPAMSGSLLAEMAQKQQAMQTANTPIAAARTKPETQQDENAIELQRSYVPSSEPAPVALKKSQEEAEVERAIAMAEAAERRAQQFLARGI